jgi:arabinogalactan endo-1,4-beta-galactosidase
MIMLRTLVLALAAASTVAGPVGARELPTLDTRFAQLDRDGDGRLSHAEFPWRRLFGRLDANADGVLTLDEVRALDRSAQGEAEPAMKSYLDVRYASVEGVEPKLLSLDVYAPSKGAHHPVVVMIHGGGWRIGDKKSAGVADVKSKHFTAAGYVFVSVNYRLSPNVMHPVHIQDVAASLAYVHEHAPEWSGNPERIYVMGHSAGAHLAALVATDDRRLRTHKKDLSIIKSVILLDGAGYDLPRRMASAANPLIRATMFEAAFGKDAKVWIDASPITHVTRGKKIPPFLIFYAGAREDARVQALALSDALRAAGTPAWPMHAPEKNHGSMNRDIGTPNDWPTEMIMSFLDRYPDRPGRAAAGMERPAKDEFHLGGDISMLTRIEELGGTFGEGGTRGDLIRIMIRHGANTFRLRLFVNPTMKNAVVQDLPYTIALAKRIKDAGGEVLLDFHYSDTWADPGHQHKPATWENLPFDRLEKTVEEYTFQSLRAFTRAGVLLDMVQIGNEISHGMLWPDGRSWDKKDPEGQRDRCARLFKAGLRGAARARGPGALPKTMIHVECGGDARRTQRFFDMLARHDVEFDLIGLSFYPWWHGTLDDLRHNLQSTSKRYNKDMVVVETAYPWRGEQWWADKPYMNWPVTQEGQKRFLIELVEAVRQTPEGRGRGVIWWYPESIPTAGLKIWNGGATALFDGDGNALPALEAFGK